MMMNDHVQYLSVQEVIAIHNAALEKFGGSAGVRDEGLLNSSCAQPAQSFDGYELYPTLAENAAQYAYGIINNHPFVDGNKRTGAAVLGTFLRLNGCRFKPRAHVFL
ncbi:MAG: type II toxin-antitoxin system death-on-curing family toxin [Actinomycetaceae bacterium]|nr:type II toxin-antitoxin system death-on-curing family toxin [Actinomycetaceae bacterium]